MPLPILVWRAFVLVLVAISMGKIAKARNKSISESSDRMTNDALILVIKQDPGKAIVVEQQQIKEIFIYRQERISESVNHQCVSRQGAFLDTGKDIRRRYFLYVCGHIIVVIFTAPGTDVCGRCVMVGLRSDDFDHFSLSRTLIDAGHIYS